jgi:hypothetical protein
MMLRGEIGMGHGAGTLEARGTMRSGIVVGGCKGNIPSFCVDGDGCALGRTGLGCIVVGRLLWSWRG